MRRIQRGFETYVSIVHQEVSKSDWERAEINRELSLVNVQFHAKEPGKPAYNYCSVRYRWIDHEKGSRPTSSFREDVQEKLYPL